MLMNRRQAIAIGLQSGVGVLGGAICHGKGAPQNGVATRGPVMLGGRRIRTIDIHAHCVIPEALELVAGARANPPSLVLGPQRLVDMDAQRIDVQVLSINQFWYSASRELAARV